MQCSSFDRLLPFSENVLPFESSTGIGADQATDSCRLVEKLARDADDWDWVIWYRGSSTAAAQRIQSCRRSLSTLKARSLSPNAAVFSCRDVALNEEVTSHGLAVGNQGCGGAGG